MSKTERQRMLEQDFRERLLRKLCGEKPPRTGKVGNRSFSKRR